MDDQAFGFDKVTPSCWAHTVPSQGAGLGDTVTGGLQSSSVPWCGRQPAPLDVAALAVSTVTPAPCWGHRETQDRGAWPSRSVPLMPVDLAGRGGGQGAGSTGCARLALLALPSAGRGEETHSLCTFHGIDRRCFCLLGD